jgi:hypothetical protein
MFALKGRQLMKVLKFWFYLALVSLFVIGCGKKSGLEGKVVDGKGQPLVNLKIVAKQVQPVKGYDQFETTTGADGIFRFEKLFPASQYVLAAQLDDFFSEETTLQTGLEEQTVNLPSQWAVRFMFSKEGLIVDSRTGFMWAPAPDQDITWDQANNYAQNIRAGGFSNWRLPSRQELESLYNPSSSNKVHPAFYVMDKWVWTAELSGSSYAWAYCFTSSGIESPEMRSNYGDYKVLVVRVRK